MSVSAAGTPGAGARVQAPGWLPVMLEARAPWEYAASLATLPLLNRLPRGDGHPVLVLPGLGASDASTAPLRRFLQGLNYTPYGWGLGTNHGPRRELLQASRALLQDLAVRHGTKVSLIGWSLGGVYAREMAKQLEPQVRCVVTLGTPFAGHFHATNVARMRRWLGRPQMAPDADTEARLKRAPNVPTTSIYSRSDGVVAWQCSLNEDLPHTENVEINASHMGMGLNPIAYAVIADRLHQDPAHWQRFDAGRLGRRWMARAAGGR